MNIMSDKLPKWLPDKDCDSILYVAQTFQAREGSLQGNYAYLSMCLQLYAGLRIGEVVTLKPKDVYFTSGMEEISVLSKKSNLERVVPIYETPLLPLLKYFQGEKLDPEKPYIQRSPKTLWALYKRIYQKAKVEFSGTHELRHTYSRNLLMNDVPIPLLSALLGHKDLRSTLVYSRLLPERDTIHRALKQMNDQRSSRLNKERSI